MTILAAILAAVAAASASPSPAPDDTLLGTWRGTSTCVDRPRHPACQDEVVVYEFRRKAGEEGVVTLNAGKIVEGQLLPMGELDFRWDAGRRAWTSEFRNERVHILWSFVVRGDAIEGTLVDLPDGSLVRNVAVKRQ